MRKLPLRFWNVPGLPVVFVALLLPVAACADSLEQYFASLDNFTAAFRQTVIDSSGEQIQDATGQVWIQRPGRFRWDYREPYSQLIVADGDRLWTYDADLEQATVKDVDEALSSTPAMLLSGFRPLSDVMSWQRDIDDVLYEWYLLTPRENDAAVEKVRLGFEKEGGQLGMIEVVDDFGNHTRIRFSQASRNTKLDPGLFTLELPDGTDVIGSQP